MYILNSKNKFWQPHALNDFDIYTFSTFNGLIVSQFEELPKSFLNVFVKQ